MLLARCRRPFPLPGPLAAVPPRPANLYFPDFAGVPPRFPGRHPAIRTAHGMGRMDRVSSYYPHCRQRRRHLCDEADAGQPQGEEEADRRECGYEWAELLRQSQHGGCD
jgi:hypothetical protein